MAPQANSGALSPYRGAASGLERRALSRPAKIGVPIGVIIGVVLVLFCSYPFIARLASRRRHGVSTGKADDTEGGEVSPGSASASASASAPENGSGPGSGSATGTTGSEKAREAPLGDGDSKEKSSRRVRTFHAEDDHGVVDQDRGGFEVAAAAALGLPLPIDTQMTTGQSASYYSAVPTESFGVDLSPEAWDEAEPAAVKRRSSGWSAKTKTGTKSSFSAWFRFTGSDKGSTSSPSTVIGPASPTPQGQAIASLEFSESPTDMAPQPNALSEPLPQQGSSQSPSPPAAVHAGHIHFPQASPPPMPVASEPASGTVAPWDVMPAATCTEQKHKLDAQLAGLSPGSPSSSASPPPPNAPNGHELPGQMPGQLPGPGLDPAIASAPVSDSAVKLDRIEADDTEAADVDMGQPVPIVIKLEPDTDVHFQRDGFPPYRGHFRNESSDMDPTDVSVSDVSTPFHNSESWSAVNTPLTNPIADSPSPGRPSAGENFGHGQHEDGIDGAATASKLILRCDFDKCGRTFDMPHRLNHHMRYHERRHVCDRDGCGKRFGTKTHLDRHINDKHEQTKKYYCTEAGCAYSRYGTKSFPRKDNMRRHMMTIHNLPTAAGAGDEYMSGT